MEFPPIVATADELVTAARLKPDRMLEGVFKGFLCQLLSAANIPSMAPNLLSAAGPIKRLIAGKAYDTDRLRSLLSDAGPPFTLGLRWGRDRGFFACHRHLCYLRPLFQT
jgi:hypothetical protein